jgi:hypothetical protein
MTNKTERNFTPPSAVRTAALKGLEAIKKYGRGGTSVAKARAQSIVDGSNLHLGVLRRMAVFYKRHEDVQGVGYEAGNGQIAWELNGGDAGRTWVERTLRNEDGIAKRYDKETIAVIEEESLDPENAPDFMVKAEEAEAPITGKVMKTFSADVTDIDEDLGLVMGWAIICKKDGEDYFDLQGDHIPENVMMKAAMDFMMNSRAAKVMHAGKQIGHIVFAWPETAEVAKAFGSSKAKQTGLKIAMKPTPAVLKRFKSGELKGFSIGGFYGETEEVKD